jgi:hypothetical protein
MVGVKISGRFILWGLPATSGKLGLGDLGIHAVPLYAGLFVAMWFSGLDGWGRR